MPISDRAPTWLGAGIAIAALAAGACGQITDIQFIAAGDWEADINNAGQVAALWWDGSSERVVRFTDGAGLELVDGVGYAEVHRPRISDTGQVVFNSNLGPVRYTDGVGTSPLQTPDVVFSFAMGIGSTGTVVGQANFAGISPTQGTRYVEGVGMVPIVPPGSSPGISAAFAMNAWGQIVGEWQPTLGPAVAVRYTPGLGMESLGTLGGAESVGHGLNDRGDVFGWSTAPNGEQYNFLYTDAAGIQSLGTTALQVIFEDINNDGWIVGADGRSFGPSNAVIWTATHGYVDLNSLVPSGVQAYFAAALSVNDHGQVAVWGSVNGQPGIYRVTVQQLPDPGGIAVLAMGLLCHRRRR
jgi:probable HAF family extracellular repeat protein